jgi:hypothetical protein
VTQPGEEIADRRQNPRRPVAILDVGGVHLGANQMPTGVRDDMALAALDLFARVVTSRTSAFGGLDRLAIDHSGRGAGFATFAFAGHLQEKEIDLLPQTLFLPRVKVVLYRRPLRKIARQQTPRTRRSQNIQESLHNPPQLYFSGSSQHFLGRHVGLNQSPFRIRHITCVTKIFAPILTASGFSPHVVAPMLHDTARISQLTEITQFIFGQPLKRSTTLAKEDVADGGKCVGNSGAYGIWAETNAETLQIGKTEPVKLYIDEEGQDARLLHPEDPGRFFCIAIAGLITSAARLMLGLAHCCVQEKGGLIAFGDTDSLAIVCTKSGGEVLIEGELHRALSPGEVEEIISRFAPLNPYGGIKTILEIKTAGGKPEPVEAFVLNTKRYAIFDSDNITVVEGKESVLGALLSPIDLNPLAEENSISKAWTQTHA